MLAQALAHESEWVRLHAANVLDGIGEKARTVIPVMYEAARMKGQNEYVRRVLDHALKEF